MKGRLSVEGRTGPRETETERELETSGANEIYIFILSVMGNHRNG